MNKQEIARFLRWGFIDDVDYPEPVPMMKDKGMDGDLESIFLNILIPLLPKHNNFVMAYSGGYAGAAYLELYGKMKNVHIVTGEFLNNAMYMAGYYHCRLDLNPFGELEKDLFDIHTFLPQPRCILGDIYVWNRQRYLAENGWFNCLCEGGSDSLFIPNAWADYSRMGILSDEDIEFLGLPEAPIVLKNETIEDLCSAIHYWYNHNLSTVRNNMMADHFGTTIISPFINEELSKFVLSLPYDLKQNGKLFKQAVPLPTQVHNMVRGNIYVNLVKMLISKGMMNLVDKYLGNKNSRIFTVLDFYKVQTFHDPIKLWQLLNLAISYEVNV